MSAAISRLSRFVNLSWRLGAVLIAAGLTASVQGQSSVTLAWDPDPGSAIAGYRLYDGVVSGVYTNAIDTGPSTTQTVSNLAVGVTYFFAVTAYDTNGLESGYSSEVTYTVPPPTNNGPIVSLTSPANGANFAAPASITLVAAVTANGHTISQVQFYNGTTLLGTATAAPYSFAWNNGSAGTCSLSAVAVYDAGNTVASAAATVTVTAAKPPSGLTFAADSGEFTAPFVASNGTLSQSVLTGVTDGGRAVYNFDLVNSGNYLVSAMVIAPSEGQNSLYVNIDADPTDPLMIWDIPVCSALTNATVSWRGNGNGDPASSQYIPKVFTLSAGTHQLIVVGREPNITLGTLTIVPTAPRLRIGRWGGGNGTRTGSAVPAETPVTLTADGSPGQTYNVLASQDLITWTILGTMTLDATGSGQFTDLVNNNLPICYYRLQAQ